MRGQAGEYVVVAAAVILMALVVLSPAYGTVSKFFYDARALVRGITAGYLYELNSFRDGAISKFATAYGDSNVDVNLDVVGWRFQDVNRAVVAVYEDIGYTVRVRR